MTDEEQAMLEGYQQIRWERDQARAGLAAMTKCATDWESLANARLAMLRRAHTVLDGCVHETCRRPEDLLSEMEAMLGLDA